MCTLRLAHKHFQYPTQIQGNLTVSFAYLLRFFAVVSLSLYVIASAKLTGPYISSHAIVHQQKYFSFGDRHLPDEDNLKTTPS